MTSFKEKEFSCDLENYKPCPEDHRNGTCISKGKVCPHLGLLVTVEQVRSMTKTETYIPKLLPKSCGHKQPKFGCLKCIEYHALLTLHNNKKSLIECFMTLDMLDRGDLGDKLQDVELEIGKLLSDNPVIHYVKEKPQKEENKCETCRWEPTAESKKRGFICAYYHHNRNARGICITDNYRRWEPKREGEELAKKIMDINNDPKTREEVNKPLPGYHRHRSYR